MSYNKNNLSFIENPIISDDFAKEILENIFQNQLKWKILKVRKFSLRSKIKFKIDNIVFYISLFKKENNIIYFKLFGVREDGNNSNNKTICILKKKRDVVKNLDILNLIKIWISDFKKWEEIKKCIKKELKEKYKFDKFEVHGSYSSKGLRALSSSSPSPSYKRPSHSIPYGTLDTGLIFGEIKIKFFKFFRYKELEYKYTNNGILDKFLLNKSQPYKISDMNKYIKNLKSTEEELNSIFKMVQWYILNYNREKILKKILEK